MTSGDGVTSQLLGAAPQQAKLEGAVTLYAGVGREPLAIRAHERANDMMLKGIRERQRHVSKA